MDARTRCIRASVLRRLATSTKQEPLERRARGPSTSPIHGASLPTLHAVLSTALPRANHSRRLPSPYREGQRDHAHMLVSSQMCASTRVSLTTARRYKGSTRWRRILRVRSSSSVSDMFSLKAVLSFVALLLSVHLVAGQAAEWGQCGGIGWTGATTCGTSVSQLRSVQGGSTHQGLHESSCRHCLHRDQCLLLPMLAWRGHAPSYLYCALYLRSSRVDEHAYGHRTRWLELHSRVDPLPDL